MKISGALLVTGALLSASATNAATPTAYIDVRLVTSSSDSPTVDSVYQFRIEAAGSDFAGAPPKAPRWATDVPLSDEGSGSSHNYNLNSKSAHKSLYSSYTLVTPPFSDEYLW